MHCGVWQSPWQRQLGRQRPLFLLVTPHPDVAREPKPGGWWRRRKARAVVMIQSYPQHSGTSAGRLPRAPTRRGAKTDAPQRWLSSSSEQNWVGLFSTPTPCPQEPLLLLQVCPLFPVPSFTSKLPSSLMPHVFPKCSPRPPTPPLDIGPSLGKFLVGLWPSCCSQAPPGNPVGGLVPVRRGGPTSVIAHTDLAGPTRASGRSS